MTLGRDRLARIGDLATRGLVAGLYVTLTRALLLDFIHTGRITGLLLLASESLVLVFTVIRRRSEIVDRSVVSAVTAGVSIGGPLLVHPANGLGLVPDALTTVVSGLGLTIVIAAKLSLGRSFGIVPANRGVVVAGLYNVVRHPIYAGYLLTHLAFALAHPIAWNVVLLMVGDVALVFRALREERVLRTDTVYQDYCRRVGWHLVPGVF
jgi:protein-S-isoprenylcysteine O-methyltransferase Ste14